MLADILESDHRFILFIHYESNTTTPRFRPKPLA